jgi:energy-coupling factor transport system substrate-specific component
MVVGAILYGTLTVPFNLLWTPQIWLISIRPTVAIPIFFGIVFGPIAGLGSGLIGSMISDFISFGGIFWNWDVGVGLIGLVAGLGYPIVNPENWGNNRGVIITTLLAAGGSAIGVGFAAVTDLVFEIGLSQLNVATMEFFSSAVTDAVNGVVWTPILLYAYHAWKRRHTGHEPTTQL